MPTRMMRPEVERLLERLSDERLSHAARAHLGERLNRLGDPRPGVGLRADGAPDVAWCYVAVPPERRGAPVAFSDQQGKGYGAFVLEPFFIAQYPVTYQQFQAFLDAPDGFLNDAWWEGLTERYRKQAMLAQRTPLNNHPRDMVSWYQSVAFARWLNARYRGTSLTAPGSEATPFILGENAEIRLPLDWEWQWAAEGPDGRAYPWGKWDGRCANTRACRLCRTTAVGMYPQGAAWCGALDMSGGLWEWG